MAQASEVNPEQNQESLQFLPGANKIDIRKKLQIDVGFKAIMNEITMRLKSINMLDRFHNSCFGHFLGFDVNFKLRGQLILLLKKCQLDVPNSEDLLFRIRGTELRFGREHFCMYTGLKFGGSTQKPADNQAPPAGGVYQAYFAERSVFFDELRKKFNNGIVNSEHLLSAAFVLFIMYLFGSQGKVPHWLWSIVEDPKFDDFPWGLYIYGMTVFHFNYDFLGPPRAKYRLKGYPMALQLWIVDCIPALGKELKKYRSATDPLSSGFPKFLCWKSTKRNPSLRNNVDDNFVECKSIYQVDPTTVDRKQVYMTSIDSPPHLDIVKYVCSEVASARVGRRIGEDRIAKRPRKGNTITIPATLIKFVSSIKKDMVEKFGALVQECTESAFQNMLAVEEDVPMRKAVIRQALKSIQYTSCVNTFIDQNPENDSASEAAEHEAHAGEYIEDDEEEEDRLVTKKLQQYKKFVPGVTVPVRRSKRRRCYG